MRHRRAERCLVRANLAFSAGDFDEARAATDEAKELAPDFPGVLEMEARLGGPRSAAEEPDLPLFMQPATTVSMAVDRAEKTRRVPLALAFVLACASVAMIAAASLGWRAVLQPPTPTALKTALRGDVTLAGGPGGRPRARLIRCRRPAVAPRPTKRPQPEPAPTPTSGVDATLRRLAAAPRSRSVNLGSLSTGRRSWWRATRPAGFEAPLHRSRTAAPTIRPPLLQPFSAAPSRSDASCALRRLGPTAQNSNALEQRTARTATRVDEQHAPSNSSSPDADAPDTDAAGVPKPQHAPSPASRPARDDSPPSIRAPAVDAVPLSASALPSPGSIPVTAPEPAAPTRSRAPEAAASTVDAQAAIRTTLGRYEAAYSGLNVPAAHAVWPSVDQRALARAFDGLASQRVALDKCDIVVTGATRARDMLRQCRVDTEGRRRHETSESPLVLRPREFQRDVADRAGRSEIAVSAISYQLSASACSAITGRPLRTPGFQSPVPKSLSERSA